MKALLASLPAIKDDPAQIEKMVAAVDRNIASTNAMLNDVLEFSRDPTALDIAEHSVPGVITAATSDALRGHPGSDVRIEYRLDHGEIPLRVDGNRVVRVLTNVLDNALDAMVRHDSGRSSGTVFISTSRASRDGKEVVGITIGNDGPDIPPEVVGRLFDPFFTSGKKGGTGLGLAICRRVISLHGGTIEARARAGGGAEFAIELPAGSGRMAMNASELIRSSSELETFRREEALRQEYGDTASVSEFLRLNKQRGRASSLLIVDDEPLFRETVRHSLEKAGEVRDHVRVIEADSGEMGLKLFEGQGFDYVIADIDLGQGHMSGYEFAREVLQRYAGAHVLIHSNKRRAEMDREIRAIASDRFMGFLPKPMRSEELLQFLACKTFEVGDAVATRPSQQKRVLVVNDDDALSFSFKIMLKAPDVQVVEARDVVTALKHLADQRVDVILSDINLGTGEPSGYDLLTSVRGRDRSVPFYVVSGYSRDQEWPKAKGMGATGYLQLPVDQEQLKAILG